MRPVEVNDANFTYRGSNTPALDHVNLTIEEGEFVLITGPTGSGKSSLLRLMNALIPHFHEGDFSGSVRVFGRNTLTVRPAHLATIVGTVFQSPEEQVVASRVWRDVAFGLENLLLEKEEIASRVDEALAFAGLAGLREREIFSLSGGEKQRLALASVLAMRPQLLLLDEPAAELDPGGRAALMRHLTHLSRAAFTIVMADHRIEDVAPLVDRAVVLNRGTVVLDGPPAEVFATKEAGDLGLEVPRAVQLWKLLGLKGVAFPAVPLTLEDATRPLREREVVTDGAP